MSKTGSFFLGMFCGVIVFILCIAIAGYCVLAFVTPNAVSGNQAGNYIGTLADKSLLDIIKEFKTLYSEANVANPDENGQYFTIADFEEKYQVNFSATFGIQLTDEIKKMPVLTLFTPNGIQKVMGQTSVTAVSDLVKIFTGAGIFSSNVAQALSQYSVTTLFSEPITVLKSVTFGDIIKGDQTRGLSDSMVSAFEQCNVGETLEVLFGGGNLLLAIKNGPLSPIGELHFYEITGGTADNSVFGDKTFAQVITDDGNLDPSLMVQGQFLGQLLSNSRRALDATSIETVYPTLVGEFVKATTSTTFTVRQGDAGYAMSTDGEQWYEATFECEDTEHQHTYDCFKFVWYTDGSLSTKISSLVAKIADCEFEDLSGDGFSNIVNSMTLRDVMGDSAVTNGILKSLADVPLQDMSATINTLTMGEVLDYQRTEVDSNTVNTSYTSVVLQEGNTTVRKNASNKYVKTTDGGTTWYEAQLACTKSHTHNTRCYQYWINGEGNSPTGFMAAISGLTIQQIQGGDAFNDTINQITLGEVLSNTDSAMLSALQDTKLSDIGTAIDNLYMGTALGLYRLEITGKDMTPVSGDVYSYNDGSVKYAIKDGTKYYSAQQNGGEYSLVWYTDADCQTPANSLNQKIANNKLGNLNSKTIENIVKAMTVQEMMDCEVLSFDDNTKSKLNSLFGGDSWKTLAIGKFINQLIGKLPS